MSSVTPTTRIISVHLFSTRRPLSLAVLIGETTILRTQRSIGRLKLFMIGELGYAECSLAGAIYAFLAGALSAYAAESSVVRLGSWDLREHPPGEKTQC